MLVDAYLLRIHGEEEHDGEARQQTGVLDGEGEEEAAATRVLFLPTHLVHLWELGDTTSRFASHQWLTKPHLCTTNWLLNADLFLAIATWDESYPSMMS